MKEVSDAYKKEKNAEWIRSYYSTRKDKKALANKKWYEKYGKEYHKSYRRKLPIITTSKQIKTYEKLIERSKNLIANYKDIIKMCYSEIKKIKNKK